VRHHDKSKLPVQGAVRREVLLPEQLEGFGDRGQSFVSIERRFAESGKMLATAEDARAAQAGEKLAGIEGGGFFLGGDGARAQHGARRDECQIHYRGEIGVEAQGAAFSADQSSMAAEEFFVAASEDVGSFGTEWRVPSVFWYIGGTDPDVFDRYIHMMAADPAARVHFYGKEVRLGRKIGHVTITGSPADDVEALRDRAVNLPYDPGSTVKAFTKAVTLEAGLITPQSGFNIPDKIQVADLTIHDDTEHGEETLTTSQIVARSKPAVVKNTVSGWR